MIFGVVSIAIESPVMILDDVTENIYFQSFLHFVFVWCFESFHYFATVVFDQFIELVPVEIDQSFDVENIL